MIHIEVQIFTYSPISCLRLVIPPIAHLIYEHSGQNHSTPHEIVWYCLGLSIFETNTRISLRTIS